MSTFIGGSLFIVFILLSQTKKALADNSLSVAVGWNKPPYVIQQTQSGYEIEFIRGVLKTMGYDARFVYIPYGRSHNILEDSDIDAAMTLSIKIKSSNVVLSEPYINYQNVAISVDSAIGRLNDVSQLAAYSVVGFQNARNLLGDTYRQMVADNEQYSEVPDQVRQLKLLYSGKAELVVMDVNIFEYFEKQLGVGQKKAATIHPLFPVSPYRMGFTDSKLRDEFNKALIAYRQSREAQILEIKYEFFGH